MKHGKRFRISDLGFRIGSRNTLTETSRERKRAALRAFTGKDLGATPLLSQLAGSVLCLFMAMMIMPCLPACAQASGETATQPVSAPAARASLPESQPSSEPSTVSASTTTSAPTSAPTTSQAVDPRVLEILAALEQAGEKYASLKADLTYQVVNRLLGDTETRTGWIAYRKTDQPGGANFRVHFDTLKLDEGATTKEELDYAYDGQRLSIAKHRIKQLTNYVVDSRNVRPMKLGEGPFPLPFGQKSADMLSFFDVSARPAGANEPKDSEYLLLIPRASQTETTLVRVEMWVASATHLPVKIVSTNKDRNVTAVSFDKLDTAAKIDASTFRLPSPIGWKETTEKLGEGSNLQP